MKGKYRKQKWQVYFWRPEFLGLPEPETLEEVEQQFRHIPSLQAKPDPLFKGLAVEMHEELVRQSANCPSLLTDYGNLIEQERERRESIFHLPLLGEDDEANHEFNEVFIAYAGEHGLIAYGRDAKIALMPDGRILKPVLGNISQERHFPAKEGVFQEIFREYVLELLEPLGFTMRIRQRREEKILAKDVDGGCLVVMPYIKKLKSGNYEAMIFIEILYDDVQELIKSFGFINTSEVCAIKFCKLIGRDRCHVLVEQSDLESMLCEVEKYLVPFLEEISTREGLALHMVGERVPYFRDYAQKYYAASCLILAHFAKLPNFDEIADVLRSQGGSLWSKPPAKDLRENFERLVAHLRAGATV